MPTKRSGLKYDGMILKVGAQIISTFYPSLNQQNFSTPNRKRTNPSTLITIFKKQ